MSHQTHYKSQRGQVFTGQMIQPTANDPNNSIKALKENRF